MLVAVMALAGRAEHRRRSMHVVDALLEHQVCAVHGPDAGPSARLQRARAVPSAAASSRCSSGGQRRCAGRLIHRNDERRAGDQVAQHIEQDAVAGDLGEMQVKLAGEFQRGAPIVAAPRILLACEMFVKPLAVLARRRLDEGFDGPGFEDAGARRIPRGPRAPKVWTPWRRDCASASRLARGPAAAAPVAAASGRGRRSRTGAPPPGGSPAAGCDR